MKFKIIVVSLMAGMFFVSTACADQETGQGGGGQQGMEQQQSGQSGGDQGAGGMQGGQQGTVPGTDQQGGSQPGGIQSQDQQRQQGTDLGGTGQPGGQPGGMMQGNVQDPATVQQIQQKLNDQGYNAGPVDGKFGPKTQEALRKFQQAQGFQATGQIDQQTMTALGVQGAGGAQPGMGSGQPDIETPGSGQQGLDQGGGTQPDSGTSSPDAGAQGTEPQGSDQGALQQ